MKLTKLQTEFLLSLGIDVEENTRMPDDKLFEIEERVADKLQIEGFNSDNSINDIGRLCESILDKLND